MRNKSFAKIFCIFIIFMAVLTFFSKSLYNYRLPEVFVAAPKTGSFTFTAEGTSQINFSRTDPFYSDVDGRVAEILVNSGEYVKKGDRIMTFRTDGSPGPLEIDGSPGLLEVRAEADGVIISIGVKKGMYVSSVQNTILYEIAVLPQELTCSLFLEEEQIENVSKESAVTVIPAETGERIEGRVQGIAAYTDQNKRGYRVSISLDTEDCSLAGGRASVSITRKSGRYDTLIPVSALRRDPAGYYVLVLKEESSVLGNGYAAKRMSVDLLDSDTVYCAVRGLPADEIVIVAATGEIADGSRVYFGGTEE